MATPEGKVKAWLDKMLKVEKVWYFSPQAGPYGQAGIPDRIGVLTGLFFGVECKADATKKMTALQERCKEKIEEAGGKFFLVYDKATIEEVRQWIVSTRCERQKGTACGVKGPANHYIRNPYSPYSPVTGFVGASPLQSKDSSNTEEPRV